MTEENITKDRKRKYSFEEIFGNKNQIKLLLILESQPKRKSDPIKGSIKIGELKRRLRVSYRTLNKYLNVLETSGLIQEITSDEKKMYRYNFENKKGKILSELIELFD
jgi:DNA-binding HxlR family transcriptional regulator